MSEQQTAGLPKPRLSYAWPIGNTLGDMRKTLAQQPLYRTGDCRLIWVNEGEFLMLGMLGVQMQDLTAEPQRDALTIAVEALEKIARSEARALPPSMVPTAREALRAIAEVRRG